MLSVNTKFGVDVPDGARESAHFMLIAVGQKFCPAVWNGHRSRMTVWRVVELYRGPDGVDHAKLVATTSAVERRTVSCDALADRRLYREMETA